MRASRHILLFLLLCIPAIPTIAQVGKGEVARADSLFNASSWKESAAAFETITRSEPKNARAWYHLGMSLYSMERFGDAVTPLTKAAQIGRNPVVMYNLACSYARSGNADSALAWLGRAGSSGTFSADQIEKDPDFASLGNEPRFRAVVEAAELASHPCKGSPEYRQLDFWVGDWDVQVMGQPAGSSSVQRILGECVIFENWSGAGGMNGKSFNVYNAATGKWQQTWVDDRGSVLELAGSFSDGAMRFSGETKGAKGKVLQRLTFFNLGHDKVRQLWEQSTDNGKTWAVTFDGLYTRR